MFSGKGGESGQAGSGELGPAQRQPRPCCRGQEELLQVNTVQSGLGIRSFALRSFTQSRSF